MLVLSLSFSSSVCSRPLSFDKYDEVIQSAVKNYWVDFPDWKYWKAQLYQESRFEEDARSPVGALGVAQFMPATWIEVTRQLELEHIPATHAKYAIEAGAFYMARMRRGWRSPRPKLEQHFLGVASYNAGTGNILRAQTRCGGALLWEDIAPCLPLVTGQNAAETVTYVERIQRWRVDLGR